jgi:hypothetical protein
VTAGESAGRSHLKPLSALRFERGSSGATSARSNAGHTKRLWAIRLRRDEAEELLRADRHRRDLARQARSSFLRAGGRPVQSERAPPHDVSRRQVTQQDWESSHKNQADHHLGETVLGLERYAISK